MTFSLGNAYSTEGFRFHSWVVVKDGQRWLCHYVKALARNKPQCLISNRLSVLRVV